MAKVATVMTDLFEDVEFTSPRDALVEAGHEVVVIGPEKGTTVTGKQGEAEVEIDLGIDDAKPEDYDALLIPGGYSPDQLRGDERFLDFVRHFSDEQKLIFSICHAPQLLVNADVLRGKDATSVSQVGVDVKNAGGNYIDQAVVIDDSGLISSRTPDDLPDFNKAIVNALNK
ncbi:MAG TPA: type 1 glutamine amidotransferase domain-containing protein [Atopostipes sp.]|jgi:protease I|nr:type 1 glutamine amidotransferase domain-containing protein [Atopostipes sp.]